MWAERLDMTGAKFGGSSPGNVAGKAGVSTQASCSALLPDRELKNLTPETRKVVVNTEKVEDEIRVEKGRDEVNKVEEEVEVEVAVEVDVCTTQPQSKGPRRMKSNWGSGYKTTSLPHERLWK